MTFKGGSFICGSTRMGLGRLRGLLVMTIMRRSEGKNEKQVPHTARKERERIRDDSAILRQRVSLEDRYSGMTVLVLRKVD